jgi:hypothetical protein
MRHARVLLPMLPGLLSLAAGGGALAAPAGAEPNPFRLEAALAGRGFNYNTESFLHRFSYRQAFPLVGGDFWPEGFYGGAGSVRATEFYAVQQVRKTVPLEDWGSFAFRYRRDEDFNGRWEQAWVGLEYRFAEAWSATALVDAQGDKEDLDAQLELAWLGEDGGRFRAALIATDYRFNSKQREALYERAPYTLFAERWWYFGDVLVYAHGNVNLRTEYRQPAAGIALDDEAQEGGVGVRWTVDSRRTLRFALQGSNADRRRLDPLSDVTLAREHLAFTAELEDEHATWPHWYGIRAFGFDERTADAVAATDLRMRRREFMAYGGTEWRLNERFRFRPELLLNYIDNDDDFESPDDLHRRGVESKLMLPLVILLDATHGARMVLAPSVELHKLGFGGADVRLEIPF